MRSTAFLACAVIIACSRSDKSVTEEPSSITSITSAPVTRERPPDDELIRRAEAALSAEAELSMAAAAVEVDVVEGIATLRGATPDAATLRAIEETVARVPGVVTTLNKVELRTPSQEESDDTMAFSLQRALVTDPAISSEADRVTIEVRSGIVSLRGRPFVPQNRDAIERVANRTPGVVVVQDLLVTSAR